MFLRLEMISLYATLMTDTLTVMSCPSLFVPQLIIGGVSMGMYAGNRPRASLNTSNESHVDLSLTTAICSVYFFFLTEKDTFLLLQDKYKKKERKCFYFTNSSKPIGFFPSYKSLEKCEVIISSGSFRYNDF